MRWERRWGSPPCCHGNADTSTSAFNTTVEELAPKPKPPGQKGAGTVEPQHGGHYQRACLCPGWAVHWGPGHLPGAESQLVLEAISPLELTVENLLAKCFPAQEGLREGRVSCTVSIQHGTALLTHISRIPRSLARHGPAPFFLGWVCWVVDHPRGTGSPRLELGEPMSSRRKPTPSSPSSSLPAFSSPPPPLFPWLPWPFSSLRYLPSFYFNQYQSQRSRQKNTTLRRAGRNALS